MKKIINLSAIFLVVFFCCFLFGCVSNQNAEEMIAEPVKNNSVTETTEELYNQFLELFNSGNIENYDALERLLEK